MEQTCPHNVCPDTHHTAGHPVHMASLPPGKGNICNLAQVNHLTLWALSFLGHTWYLRLEINFLTLIFLEREKYCFIVLCKLNTICIEPFLSLKWIPFWAPSFLVTLGSFVIKSDFFSRKIYVISFYIISNFEGILWYYAIFIKILWAIVFP